MEQKHLREVTGIPSRKRDFREQKRYRKLLWGMLFLELLLRKIQEKTLPEAGGEQKDETAGERVVRWPVDWEGRDSLEVTIESCIRIAFSESYDLISGDVRRAGWCSSASLLKEASGVMADFYAGRLDEEMTGHMSRAYCTYYIEGKAEGKIAGLAGEPQAEEELRRKELMEVLLEVYEYFSRANVRRAVAANNEEGRRLVEESGLSWAGTTYYNARYFHVCERMNAALQGICADLAADYGLEEPDFDEVERHSRFRLDGGLSFHGVFEWVQKQDNYPPDQYGMKDKSCRPPWQFVYLYRNCCSQGEKRGIECLGRKLRETASREMSGRKIWRTFSVTGGREYHNGMSYLPDELPMDRDPDLIAEAARFLINFKLYRVSGCVEMLQAGEPVEPAG